VTLDKLNQQVNRNIEYFTTASKSKLNYVSNSSQSEFSSDNSVLPKTKSATRNSVKKLKITNSASKIPKTSELVLDDFGIFSAGISQQSQNQIPCMFRKPERTTESVIRDPLVTETDVRQKIEQFFETLVQKHKIKK